MAETTPLSVPVVVSAYTRTHFDGDRVVYTKHIHEGSTEAGSTNAKHIVQELGYVTYSRDGLQAPKTLPGMMVSIYA
ncbi:MAG: hypothetical protein VW270_30800 [Candidatus Poseidoniales archaeon]